MATWETDLYFEGSLWAAGGCCPLEGRSSDSSESVYFMCSLAVLKPWQLNQVLEEFFLYTLGGPSKHDCRWTWSRPPVCEGLEVNLLPLLHWQWCKDRKHTGKREEELASVLASSGLCCPCVRHFYSTWLTCPLVTVGFSLLIFLAIVLSVLPGWHPEEVCRLKS
jgi:hypothetical protein